ncbi:ubiquitin carboxyl-terminal hydrolase MINDY-1 [Pleuronectes platessa]|uniref:ubiquitin carboxyl-terminal hydrolase MINDY-1 n=1 Tax=Pleuronectes platessa TaxID=8262 RepID=UPI00232A5501|nr:ubiquitin carboxyl-terminal hydrolase MINDY-1 [Pleuronectes platessa]
MMADSSSQQAAAADLLIEPILTTETTSKELIITTAMEERGQMMESDVVAEVGRNYGIADSPLPGKVLKEEEALPPTLSTENRRMTLLRHMENEGGRDRGGDTGLDLEDSSSVATAGSSEDQQESTASASFSIPSLELSDGVTATGNSQDVEDSLSSSFSAVGAQGCALSAGVSDLKDGDALEAAGGAVPAAAPPAVACSSSSSAAEAGAASPVPAYYLVKWITWKEKKTPIITQSENGPCPLLAIMNTLFLRWKAKLPAQTEVVTTEDLMAHLGECVLSVTPREKTDGMELNFQQNMSDAMAVLPKLSTGLDVNVRFTGATDFEYTPECIAFDLLDIPLYHGWLVDPQSPEMVSAVGKLSYNQLVEKIIDYKHSADSSRVSEGLVAEQFLESTATQLSYHGLCELNTTAKEGEISVFFRNNHFSTMIKHKGHLYLLVTDQGFLQEEPLVWESLHNVEGDGNFCDSDFRLCHQRAPPTAAPPAQEQRRQIDQDYLVAVSLQQQGGAPGPLSDLELARQLQQEEYQQQQQLQQPGAVQTQQVRGQGSQQTRRREKDSDCVLL